MEDNKRVFLLKGGKYMKIWEMDWRKEGQYEDNNGNIWMLTTGGELCRPTSDIENGCLEFISEAYSMEDIMGLVFKPI